MVFMSKTFRCPSRPGILLAVSKASRREFQLVGGSPRAAHVLQCSIEKGSEPKERLRPGNRKIAEPRVSPWDRPD